MKPFISYVGSKVRVMHKINEKLPKTIDRYFEPFLGGGSVLFNVAEKRPEIKGFYVNDLEKSVINMFLCVKKNCPLMIEILTFLNKHRSKENFLKFVECYNNDKKLTLYERSALLVYFFRLAFNSNLKFEKDKINPSYSASHAKSNIFSADKLKELCSFFHDINFYSEDYIKFLNRFTFKKNDFVFLDPPYKVPYVTEYYNHTFKDKDYANLLKVCDKIDKSGAKWMLTLDIDKSHQHMFRKYKIHRYRRHSFITSGVNKDKEVIITNY